MVECKNRATAAKYQDVAVFYNKMQSRGRKLGIFVASAGITGRPVGTTAAHSVLARRALSHTLAPVVTSSPCEHVQVVQRDLDVVANL